MPHPRRKGRGWSSRYWTRTQATKKLQVSLKTFRQLCIYKGIHPRVPKKTGSDARVFYHKKDIRFLAHEPSLNILRKQRQFLRKIRAARNRKDKKEVQRLEMQFPKIRLSHILKERYPTFEHALRDLDDPLTMAHLYANMHQQGNYREGHELHASASQLCAEFQAYVVRTHSLRKVFVSVKGYYYQADIMGTKVTWCVPHKFVQNFDTKQIDPFVMTCYMEFYKTMLGFVNFRLFHSVGMAYPPNPQMETTKAALLLESLLNEVVSQTEKISKADEKEMIEIEENDVQNDETEENAKTLFTEDATVCSRLFRGLVFFCARETPIDHLVFIIRAFGGIVAWECEDPTFDISNPTITHCICDRDVIKEEFKAPGREYVQPQWIFDCCNAKVLLPTEPYAIGQMAPPHLSPFVSLEDEEYVPDYAKEIRKIQEAANLVQETNDTSAQERAIKEIIAEDVLFQEEEELEKIRNSEQAYAKELELELESEFPDAIPDKSALNLKLNRQQEVLDETQKMEEVMVTKRHLYNKLKRKEKHKRIKTEKLKKRKANLETS